MKILDKSAAELIQSFALLCLVVSAAPLAWSQMSESSPGLQDKPIVIRVSRSDTRQDIASTLFGSFLEPIGHSTYGGLWANRKVDPRANLIATGGDGGLFHDWNAQQLNPDRVIAVTHTERFTAKHSYTFPSASVTVIEIPLKN